MSAPHVAGVVALILHKSPSYTVDDVKDVLYNTAVDLGDAGYDPLYGWGRVDAYAAVAAAVGVPENDPPTASITSPADGANFDSGATIVFQGTATDTEDGDLTAALGWTSSKDGPIGTGGSFSTTLSDGTHTITASVTDSGGKTGSASVDITVGTPPAEPTTVSVQSITYNTVGGRDGKKHLNITVALVDDLGGSVAGASVSIELYLEGDLILSESRTTEADGTAAFSKKNAPSGCYTTEVTSVSAEGLHWDGVTQPNEYCK